MAATESREQQRKRQEARLERAVLRLKAAAAQKHGIDIFQPGWGDEYAKLLREQRERLDDLDSLIGTPHINEAVAALEEQFEHDPL